MAKQRFRRLVWKGRSCGMTEHLFTGPRSYDVLNAHSTAIEEHDSEIACLTKGEGRHRRRMEKIEQWLEAVALRGYDTRVKVDDHLRGDCSLPALEKRLARLETAADALQGTTEELRGYVGAPPYKHPIFFPIPPTPEPVVVEGRWAIWVSADPDRINASRVILCDDDGTEVWSAAVGDRVRLTIERIDDE